MRDGPVCSFPLPAGAMLVLTPAMVDQLAKAMEASTAYVQAEADFLAVTQVDKAGQEYDHYSAATRRRDRAWLSVQYAAEERAREELTR